LTRDGYEYILIIDRYYKRSGYPWIKLIIKTNMPFGDGTGPLGLGPGFWGRGRGRGIWPCWRFPWLTRGWRWADIAPKEEKEVLDYEAELLKEELKEVEKRIQELKGQK